jgi:hypothetical protein
MKIKIISNYIREEEKAYRNATVYALSTDGHMVPT